MMEQSYKAVLEQDQKEMDQTTADEKGIDPMELHNHEQWEIQQKVESFISKPEDKTIGDLELSKAELPILYKLWVSSYNAREDTIELKNQLKDQATELTLLKQEIESSIWDHLQKDSVIVQVENVALLQVKKIDDDLDIQFIEYDAV